MTCTSDYQPLFRPQNPALSGDKNGWVNCAAYVGGYAADYSTCGVKQPTGAYVRSLTNEPIPDPNSPGLTITQVANALARIGVTVYPFTRAPWSQLITWWEEGRYISLCGQYSVIRPTRFSGDRSFYGGHQIGVPGTLKAEDPLTDGRRAGIYKYHGEAYPVDLLRAFAGAFRVRRAGGLLAPIGLGYAQGFYTIAHPAANPVPPPVIGGDMAISTGGIALSSGYVIDLPAGTIFYATPSTAHPLTTLHAAAAPLFTGNVIGTQWRAVQVNTGAPYSDGVTRPTQVYIPFAAGTPRKK